MHVTYGKGRRHGRLVVTDSLITSFSISLSPSLFSLNYIPSLCLCQHRCGEYVNDWEGCPVCPCTTNILCHPWGLCARPYAVHAMKTLGRTWVWENPKLQILITPCARMRRVFGLSVYLFVCLSVQPIGVSSHTAE